MAQRYKFEIAYVNFWSTCVAQKRLCLSSPITLGRVIKQFFFVFKEKEQQLKVVSKTDAKIKSRVHE